MNAVFWFVCGALAGVAASWHTRVRRHLLRNVTIGAIGGLAGGWLAVPYLGSAVARDAELSVPGLLAATVTAVVLLVVAALYRQGTLR